MGESGLVDRHDVRALARKLADCAYEEATFSILNHCNILNCNNRRPSSSAKSAASLAGSVRAWTSCRDHLVRTRHERDEPKADSQPLQ